jgi:hypothetical protein
MKKLIPLLFAVFAFTACEKDADTDKLDNNFVVYTNYDKSADFKLFETYYLPDSILIIGDKDKAEYWSDTNAKKIIDTYIFYMDNCGYIRETNRENADLGLQISYVNYAYSTGSFLTELLNLKAPQGQSAKLPILWTAYMSGMLSGSTDVNVQLATQAVAQAFSQSAYLNKK